MSTKHSIEGVSVIVPTYNRLSSLKRCIESILKQQFVLFEIIVVNDGSTDGTLEYLHSLNFPNLRVLNLVTNSGVCTARNTGISAALLPILVFTDDDCVAMDDWLWYLVSPFSELSCGLVIGQTWYYSEDHRPRFPERVVHNHNAAWPMTCNMAYRKEVFEQLGGFSHKYSNYHNEDTEMAIRAVAGGWGCLRALEAQVSHQHSLWTNKLLLSSAKNPCAAILLKRDYPNYHEYFGKQLVAQHFLRPEDYFVIISIIMAMPLLILICVGFGRKGLLFFNYWFIRHILRRIFVYQTAWECRLVVI
ncbi:MAG: glycosyltransferase family 2 protein [Bacteroidetes bacterium]|nr:glycosyltransferase family 2 protein [Bacteroidota bacterium]